MADDAAKWGGLDLEVPPPFMEPIITAINDVLELIVVFLDIVLIVCEIAKVFILGMLSPILAVLEAVIALLEALANDLRKAGFYFRYDDAWFNDKHVQETMTHYMGGFSAFDTRCFNWLIDSKDPNRPDFSTASGVIGLFFYASVDISEIMKLIKMIMGLIKFFSNYPGKGSMLQTPTDLEFTFKRDFFTTEGWSDMWESDDTPPSMGELTWGFSAAPANALGIALPAFPPDSCIIEISTVPDGLMVGASRTVAGATDAKKKKNAFVMAPIMDGGGPLKIYGGTRCLVGGETGKSRNQLLTGDPLELPKKDGLWLVKNPEDPNPIYLKEWVDAEAKAGGAGPIMQKQVVIHHNNAMNYFFPEFKYTLIHKEMPYPLKSVTNGKPTAESEPAREVWVRIAAGTDVVAGVVGNEPDDSWYAASSKETHAKTVSEGHSGYKVENLYNPQNIIHTQHFPAPNSRGRLSAPIKVNFPSAAQKDFMQMVKVAATMALLCRGELDPDPTAAKPDKPGKKQTDCGFWKLSKLLLQSFGIRGYKVYHDFGPAFTGKLMLGSAAENIAEAFQRRAGSIPDAVFEGMVKAHGKNLLFYMGNDREHDLVEETIPSFQKTCGVQDSGAGSMYSFSAKDEETLAQHCVTWESGKDSYIGVHMNRNAPWTDAEGKVGGAVSYGWKYGKEHGVRDSTFCPDTLSGKADNIPVFVGFKDMGADEDNLKDGEMILSGMNNGTIGSSMYKDSVLVPARNCFTTDQLNSALAVLNIATIGTTDGKWIAIRPLETIMLPVEEFLEKLINWLKNVRDGLLAIIQQILDYIRMIEARIMEIQQLIRKIQAILRMFSDFTVSADLHFLVCTGAGTQGLISEYMMSENKPADGPGAIGSGACVVAGGLPLIILDLLKAIFAASEKNNDDTAAADADAAAMLADEGL